MIQAATEDKYCFNMQVSSDTMASCDERFRDRTTIWCNRFSRYQINDLCLLRRHARPIKPSRRRKFRSFPKRLTYPLPGAVSDPEPASRRAKESVSAALLQHSARGSRLSAMGKVGQEEVSAILHQLDKPPGVAVRAVSPRVRGQRYAPSLAANVGPRPSGRMLQSLKVLERFRAKWTPVRVKKTRQNKRLEPGSDSIRTDKALAACQAADLAYRRAFDLLSPATMHPASLSCECYPSENLSAPSSRLRPRA